MKSEKVLLTGGTGFIGKKLGLALVRAGNTVSILTRNPNEAQKTLPFPAQTFSWDQLPDALQDVTAIIHLAGDSIADGKWDEEKKARILSSRLKTTQALTDAIQKNKPSKLQALIGASAIGFYGDRGNEELNESSSAGSGFLAQVCDAWEKELFKQPPSIRTCAIRIGIVLGSDGGALEKMLPIFRAGLGGKIGSGKQWMSWIHIDDLVQIFIRAIQDPAMQGVWNGVAPQAVTNIQWTRELSRRLERPAVLPVPATALRLALGEFSEALTGSAKVSSEKIQQLGLLFQYPDLRSAFEALIPAHGDLLFESLQWVPKSVSQVFPFFSKSENLEKLTPAFLNFSIVSKSTPEIEQETRIVYQLKIHGVPVKWQTRIAAWDPPRSFVDIQEKGPYSKWHHTHEFESLGEGTLLKDRVLYRLPMGLPGLWLTGKWIQNDVKKIFQYRRKIIEDLYFKE